ncbi:hypothetical protein BG32_01930 [Mesotoga sp. HF07.pep.5.2.highcov]|uniref:MBOAT family O-acyltransferase n=1 Tax=Mesotoga sp. HF07.pep.5.2.highcov TaxID=1462923 RepID=UPI000EF15EB7|nr:MBOAT family O-acyltransferase [Mesotoga sp. HF07.pep.5.2.highcov]RLL88073.1 hypothetical protein BG32_01930 [Mesotoga sp. HF07.pep.5.2.highcov]
MFFNSIEYFLFLPAIYLIFYFTPDRFRWIVLLSGSIFFYASLMHPYLLLVLFGVMLATYVFGKLIAARSEEKEKKRLFWIGTSMNLAILVGMKYLPFITENLDLLLKAIFGKSVIPICPVIVSIGVSFYVFQAISYLNDIYLEIQEPERHFGYFALYISFFPKILQGPIERANSLLPQLKKPYEFNYDNMRSGMLLFTWGLFKKVVIADRLAVLVNTVYGNVSAYTGLPLIVATYAYAIQIYMDFSGYTDMALGTARLFNINLTDNFNRPYLATSVAQFWRRWHISFSSWLQDYLFKPLQMRMRNWKSWGSVIALLITFFISGLWHGAAWTFVIWGLLHGLYMAAAVLYKPLQKKIYKKLKLNGTKILKLWKTFITFNLVSFAWIFFRAKSLGDSGWIITKLFTGLREQLGSLSVLTESLKLGLGKFDLAVIAVSLVIVMVFEFTNKANNEHLLRLQQKPIYLRWIVYYLLVMWVALFSATGSQEFVYFRF